MVPPACPRCHVPLPTDAAEAGALTGCPQCRTPLRLAIFPAIQSDGRRGATAESVLTTGEAACFYHATRKAVAPCDQCGRFLCALCDLELGGGHYCPQCLDAGTRRGTLEILEPRRLRADSIAGYLLLLGVITCGFAMPLTGPAALIVAWRYRKSPPSQVDNTPRRLRLVMVAGFVELILGVALWLAVVSGQFTQG